MRLKVLISCIAVLLAFVLSSCNKGQGGADNPRSAESPVNSQPQAADGVRLITADELRRAMERGEALVVDVRGPVEYELSHIKGSISMPLGLVAKRAGELPKDKLIVTYCA